MIWKAVTASSSQESVLLWQFVFVSSPVGSSVTELFERTLFEQWNFASTHQASLSSRISAMLYSILISALLINVATGQVLKRNSYDDVSSHRNLSFRNFKYMTSSGNYTQVTFHSILFVLLGVTRMSLRIIVWLCPVEWTWSQFAANMSLSVTTSVMSSDLGSIWWSNDCSRKWSVQVLWSCT